MFYFFFFLTKKKNSSPHPKNFPNFLKYFIIKIYDLEVFTLLHRVNDLNSIKYLKHEIVDLPHKRFYFINHAFLYKNIIAKNNKFTFTRYSTGHFVEGLQGVLELGLTLLLETMCYSLGSGII